MNCPSFETLAAWVVGEVTPEVDPQLREHTRGCVRCAAETERLRAVTQALPQLQLAGPAPRFTRELVAKLDERRHQPHPGRRTLVAVTGLAAICLVSFGVIRFEDMRADDQGTFMARGGAARRAPRVGFEIYAHVPGRQPFRIHDKQSVRTDTGYSFVVTNRSQRRQYAMLFAVDARSDVHWFYPAFLDSATDPQSIVVDAQPQVQALPDGITPEDPAPGWMRFVGVFSKAPLRVSEVEGLLRSGGLDALARAHADAEIQSLQAELRSEDLAP
jgi:hypothetical protein